MLLSLLLDDLLHSDITLRLSFIHAILGICELNILFSSCEATAPSGDTRDSDNKSLPLMLHLSRNILTYCRVDNASDRYHALEVMNRWMQRLSEYIKAASSSSCSTVNIDIQQHKVLIVKQLRAIADNMLTHNWQHPQKTIVQSAKQIFKGYIKHMNAIASFTITDSTIPASYNWMPDVQSVLNELQGGNPSRGKYNLLACLLPCVRALDVVNTAPWLLKQLLMSQSYRPSAGSSASLFISLINQLKQEMIVATVRQSDMHSSDSLYQQQLRAWRSLWSHAVIQSIQADNQLIRDGVSNTIMPLIFIQVDSSCFQHLLEIASLPSSSQSASLERMRGLIVLLKVITSIRTCNPAASPIAAIL
jgi:hypothetical protein